MWNFSVLISFCALGLRQCSILNDMFDVLNIVLAVSAGAIVYLAYQNKKRHINQFLYLFPSLIIAFALVIWFSKAVF
jgi:hypothetical protein